MEFLKKLAEDYHLFFISDDGEVEEIPLNNILDNEEEFEEPVEDDDLDLDDFEQSHNSEGDLDSDEDFEPDFAETDIKGNGDTLGDIDFYKPTDDYTFLDDLDDNGDEDSEKAYDLNPQNFEQPGSPSFNRHDSGYNKSLTSNVDDGLDLDGLDDFGDDTDETKGELSLDPDLSGLNIGDEENDEFEDENHIIPLSASDTNADWYKASEPRDDNEWIQYPSGQEGTLTANVNGLHGLDTESDDWDSLVNNVNSDDASENDLDNVGDDDNSEENEGEEDSDYQGIVRSVPGAYLVFKRKSEDGTYEELWAYSIGKDHDLSNQHSTKRKVLAGTDINPKSLSSDSEDGMQHADQWVRGNIALLHLSGLPN